MTTPIRIPADVDLHDRVLGPLTARQLAILTGTALLLYCGWAATRAFVPIPLFLALAIPAGAAATFLALGQRDGISMDRLLVAAIRQRMTPRHQVAAPEGVRPAPGWLTAHTADSHRPGANRPRKTARVDEASPSALRLPAEAVSDAASDVGVIDLGVDGLAVIAVASTVNFALQTLAEQESLVASFGRYLHSLTAPVQVLVRTERLDLTSHITDLRERAGGLPHPALEAAALEHATYLAQLGEHTDLLRRQVLLILRESLQPAGSVNGLGGPGPLEVLASLTRTRRSRRAGGPADAGVRRAAESRLVRRLGEAVELLAPAGIVLTGLDAGQATGVLASACNPDTMRPVSVGMAGAEEIITSPGGQHLDPYADPWPSDDSDTSNSGREDSDPDPDTSGWDDGDWDDGDWDGGDEDWDDGLSAEPRSRS